MAVFALIVLTTSKLKVMNSLNYQATEKECVQQDHRELATTPQTVYHFASIQIQLGSLLASPVCGLLLGHLG